MSYLDEFRELIGKLPASISSCTKLIDGFARADARIAELEKALLAERERICAAIKAADDAASACDYMLDSDDCIAVVRGELGSSYYVARAEFIGESGDALREFAVEIMGYWPHGDVDGGDLQNMAIKHKLIAPKNPKPTEPCGEYCACAGYPTQEEWAEGIDCYAWTPLLIGKIDAARGAG
jgi:hypothetical protein